jgi:hypothetical protein
VRLLKTGARIIFDDYLYYTEMTEAIDNFHRIHEKWLVRF